MACRLTQVYWPLKNSCRVLWFSSKLVLEKRSKGGVRNCGNAAMHPLQAPSTPPASAARFDSGMKVWSGWVSCNSSGTVQDCRLIVAVVVRWPRGQHKMTIVQHHGITARLAQAWYMTLINLLPEDLQNALLQLSLLVYLELPYLNLFVAVGTCHVLKAHDWTLSTWIEHSEIVEKRSELLGHVKCVKHVWCVSASSWISVCHFLWTLLCVHSYSLKSNCIAFIPLQNYTILSIS